MLSRAGANLGTYYGGNGCIINRIGFCKENPVFDFEILQDIINTHNKDILDLIAPTLPIIQVSI